MAKKSSYDFYLILATTLVLSAISIICIYGMFHFKFARVQEMEAAAKLAYMHRMNLVISPFLILLIILLSICVPKRLLPTRWLNRFAVTILAIAISLALAVSIKAGLILVLATALVLQVVVLVMALAGSTTLNFEKKGYWVRVGSSCMHLGLILFILDLLLHRYQTLHLALFWVTTASTVLGMLFCFYAESVAGLLKKVSKTPAGNQDNPLKNHTL